MSTSLGQPHPGLTGEGKISSDEGAEDNAPINRVPPNGGLRAWACVAGSFLLQFCSFGYVNAYDHTQIQQKAKPDIK